VATLIVVRRDAGDTFQHFRTALAPLGHGVELLWDRRTGERRHPQDPARVERRTGERRAEAEGEPVFLDEPRRMERRQEAGSRLIQERRRAERRQRAPDTWQTLGFVLVRSVRVEPRRLRRRS
jgi:hypothetical protein